MKKRSALLVICLLAALFPTASWAGEHGAVESEGYGVSREDALLAAQREALQKGISTLLISETEVENFTLKRDMVLSRTMGAIRGYDILAERREGNIYFVTISALVSEADIRHGLAALKILLESMDKPRILVLVREDTGRSAEAALVDYLVGRGFAVVDTATVTALMARDNAHVTAATSGDARVAARLAADNGADYILVGRVKQGTMNSQLLAGTGLVSGQAAITVRVVNAANAAVLVSKSATSGAAHVTAETAMEVAAGKAARKVMDQALFETIVASFQERLNNGRPIEVTFYNVNDFQTQQEIRAVVSGLADFSLQDRSFGGGQLVLSLLFKGNVDDFCRRLDGKRVQNKRLSVTRIAGSRVVVALR